MTPKTIQLGDSEGAWVIYTDGVFADGIGSWGALAFDPTTNRRLVFAGEVPKCLMEFWQRTVGEQLICEIELFAYIAAQTRTLQSIQDCFHRQ